MHFWMRNSLEGSSDMSQNVSFGNTHGVTEKQGPAAPGNTGRRGDDK